MNHLCYSAIRLIERPGLSFPAPSLRKSIWRIKNMTVTRWDPFREVVALQNRVNSLFRDLGEDQDTAPAASFVPAVDIYEDAKKVVLKLEVPGIEEKDLDIRVENHTLTVKGERKFEVEEKEQNFHRIERRYGSFFRAFTLPTTVDTESVQASHNAGVLKLALAKKPEAQPKQIKINVDTAKKVEAGKNVEEPELAGVR